MDIREASCKDFRKLQYFIAAVEWKNFTVAAMKNNISQQALSKHISDLEYELNCHLFTRTKTSVSLTPEGEPLLADAYRIMEDHDLFLNHAHVLSKTSAGELRIGYGGYWEYPFLFETVSRFSKMSPYTNFVFHREHHGKLIQNFRQRNYDMILTFERESIKPFPNTAWFQVDSSPLYAVVSEQHWLASRDAISLKDLEHETLVCISRANDYVFNENISEALENAGVRPDYYADSPDNAFDCLLLVAANKGISFYTEWMQQIRCPGVRYIPLDPPSKPLSFGIAYWVDQQLPLIEKFVGLYKEVYQESSHIIQPSPYENAPQHIIS